MPPLEIGLLGGFTLKEGDRQVTRLGSSRAEKLLAYLLVHRSLPQSRRRLAYSFWPDSREGQAQTNLRRELHRLRRLLPPLEPLLVVGEQSLGVRPDMLSLDLERFEAALEASQASSDERVRYLREAVAIYRGDLLPEMYDDWVELERARLRDRYADALQQLIDELESRREYRAALDYALRLTRHDPLLESGRLALMRLHALSGDKAAAVVAYREFEELLERELGVEPGDALKAAHERSRTGWARLPPKKAAEGESLVGRESEWRSLRESWQLVAGERARAVAISGEAGIGKTRLAEELCQWVEGQGYVWARARCYRAEGRLAFSPISEWFRQAEIARAAAEVQSVWRRELGRLMPELATHEQQEAPDAQQSEGWRRRQLFEALSRAVNNVPQPLLLLLDDAQWCDSETLEWLHFLLRSDSTRLLLVLTIRSEEQLDNRPLGQLLLELRRLELLDEIPLAPLEARDARKLASQVAGRELGDEESMRLYAATAGHPLYVVETVRADVARAPGEPSSPRTRGLPPRVHAVIAARLGQLSQPARYVSRLAAAVGRPFTPELLSEAGELDEAELVTALDELWQRRIIKEHGTEAYDFTHDLLREVAHGEVGPAPRKLLHRRIAEALERLHSADLESVSARIAAHYEQAGKIARAVHFLERAAAAARGVSAGKEAMRLLGHGLALLQRMPSSPERDRLELALQYALSAPLNITFGYSSAQVEASLERVRVLGERLRQERTVIRGLVGLVAMHYVRGDNRTSWRIGEEAVSRARAEPDLLPEAHFILEPPLLGLGRFDEAYRHSELSAAAALPHTSPSLVFGSDLQVFRGSYAAHLLWLLGRPEPARSALEGAMERAEWLEDPYNLALSAAYGAMLAQFSGDVDETDRLSELSRTLCERYDYSYYLQWSEALHGWVRAVRDEPEDGLRQIEAALEGMLRVGALARRPYYLSLQADALLRAGRGNKAEAVLTEALELSAANDDVWWDAELHRLRGRVAADRGETLEAADSYQRAMEVATSQGANLLRLRAALDLARVQAESGRRDTGKRALQEASLLFEEGSDTPDLVAAKELLEAWR